jgi:aspartyl protease family protein
MFLRPLLITLLTAVLAVAVARSVPLLAGLGRPAAVTEAEAPPAMAPPDDAGGETRPQPARRADGRRQVALRRDASGHFFTNAVVNGRTIAFLVDTGATLVALDEATARRLGYQLDRSAFRYSAATANGDVPVASITLREVRVGGIAIRDVEAMVLPGGALDGNLLGMSFLNRLSSFSVEGEQLVMRK